MRRNEALSGLLISRQMSKTDPESSSAARLALCVSLPIALIWWLPRSYGASLEAFPLMLSLLAAGLTATVGLGGVSRGVSAWLAAIAALVLLRGSPIALYALMMVPVILAVWIGVALGGAAARDGRIARAIGWGLAFGVGINFLSALLQFLEWEQHFYPWFSLNGSDRIYGNLRQSNQLATLFVSGLALLWWLAARRVLSDWQVAALVLCLSFGVAMTASRTGWIELCAFALLVLWWRKSVNRQVLACFLATPFLVMLLSLGMNEFGSAQRPDRNSITERGDMTSLSRRLVHWEAAIELIHAQPLQGIGWKEFRTARIMVRPQDATVEVVDNAHNSVLHLAAELGIPAALLIVVPMLFFVSRQRPWREANPGAQAAWLVLAALLLHSMVEYPLWYLNFLMLGAMATGFVLACNTSSLEKALPVPKIAGWALVALTTLALVDYDRASAPYGKTFFNWGETDDARLAVARRSLLFDIYADRALLPRVPVTLENHRLVAQLADRLMHLAPDPQVLDARLLAYCAGGETAVLDQTVHIYRFAYPQHFAEFKGRLAPTMVQRCRL